MKKINLFMILFLTSTITLGQEIKIQLFEKSNNYGFDSLVYNEAKYSYPETKITGGEYSNNPWISVECNKEVAIKIKSSSKYTLDNLILTDLTKSKANKMVVNGNAVFSIMGKPTSSEDFYFLLNKKGNKLDTLAGISVVSYSKEKYNLVLIPLENVKIPDNFISSLNEKLNKIFKPAVVEWNINTIQEFRTLSGIPSETEFPETEKYTNNMNLIIKAYKKNQKPEKKVTYLFITEKSSNDTNTFIPKGKQFGFISLSATPRDIAQIILHGVFKTDYIYNITSQAKGTTNNLMDKGSGCELIKVQWDNLH